MTREQQLADVLSEMAYWESQADTTYDDVRVLAYAQRTRHTYLALYLAEGLGYPAGIRLDPADPHWPVAYILLPTGQVSWHLSEFSWDYDQHTTEEKWARVHTFIGGTRGH